MKKHEYHDRKSRGICVGSTACGLPAVDGRYCKPHADDARARRRAWNKRTYQSKKLAGVCVDYGCKSPCLEDGVLCATHRDEMARKRNTVMGRRRHAANDKRWRKNKIRAGLCSVCGHGELYTDARCEPCAARDRDRKRAKFGWKPREDRPVRLDSVEYATARNYHGPEMVLP